MFGDVTYCVVEFLQFDEFISSLGVSATHWKWNLKHPKCSMRILCKCYALTLMTYSTSLDIKHLRTPKRLKIGLGLHLSLNDIFNLSRCFSDILGSKFYDYSFLHKVVWSRGENTILSFVFDFICNLYLSEDTRMLITNYNKILGARVGHYGKELDRKYTVCFFCPKTCYWKIITIESDKSTSPQIEWYKKQKSTDTLWCLIFQHKPSGFVASSPLVVWFLQLGYMSLQTQLMQFITYCQNKLP